MKITAIDGCQTLVLGDMLSLGIFGRFFQETAMSEIHYFPRYSMQENVVTNNSLLLLLRLYQYNRYKFEKFMEALGVE